MQLMNSNATRPELNVLIVFLCANSSKFIPEFIRTQTWLEKLCIPIAYSANIHRAVYIWIEYLILYNSHSTPLIMNLICAHSIAAQNARTQFIVQTITSKPKYNEWVPNKEPYATLFPCSFSCALPLCPFRFSANTKKPIILGMVRMNHCNSNFLHIYYTYFCSAEAASSFYLDCSIYLN